MQNSFKIIFVLILVFLVTGCAAGRRKRRTEVKEKIQAEMDIHALVTEIRAYNITDEGFIIKKGRLSFIDGAPVEGEYGFTAKLNNEGDFYASVKGPLGIELMRILAVGDDVCGIVRLTRTVYVGKKSDLTAKYGLPENFITAMFGDMPVIEFAEADSIAGDKLIIKKYNDKLERLIHVCLDEMKVCEETVYSVKEKKRFMLVFSNFNVTEDRKYASEIDIRQLDEDLHVKLYIETFVPGCDEKIEFEVPSYKKESL